MTTTGQQHRTASLALVLALDAIMFGLIPIFQVILIMETNVTRDLPLAKVTASLALAVFCIASCYWVWQEDNSARYLLLAGITISSIITTIVKISVLRDERVSTLRAWTLVHYFLPTLFFLFLNWTYFMRSTGSLTTAGDHNSPKM